MLREWITLLCDRGTRQARRFGHDREAVAIAARHRRCHAAWKPHLEAAKALVLTTADTAPGRDTAVILGSGLCLDVPVEELCARFGRVFLVDAHHPRPVRKLARRHRNLRLVTADVTGMGEPVARAAASGRPLPDPVFPPDPLPPGLRPDFTISLNLASQLPIPFYKVLDGRVDADVLKRFGRELIEAHFAWLERLPGRVGLVCDRLWERVDGDGAVVESRDALEGAQPPVPDRAWIWDIAPRPEESHCYDRRNQVWGYLDFAASRNGKPAGTGSQGT
ncbi:conserved hypothetical protein [Solidesulfovibrio fructosivorans JJ]]|uniref:Class I SAM-dependent methyltransferase n=1 Tax=Solidesulfovibrio fructosivorans JJ] TaxID=596151 RepID=E1JZA4_SOLFR|nr:hypothetical protein [Solidesulfovibrio fructosivorans]EFL50264.1 conserved hypothetical protein [Solidesulfovibrio fructosivorans JJ]]